MYAACLASPTSAQEFFRMFLPIPTMDCACALKSNQALAFNFVLFLTEEASISWQAPIEETRPFDLTNVPCKNPEKKIDLENIFGFQMIWINDRFAYQAE